MEQLSDDSLDDVMMESMAKDTAGLLSAQKLLEKLGLGGLEVSLRF